MEHILGLPRANVRPGWQYEEAESAALALEQLLRTHGIEIQPGSPFETDVLEVLRVVDHKRRGYRVALDPDYRPAYRSLVGVHELASAILAAASTPSFGALVPHLELLNQGSALQNRPSGAKDQATDKIFELFVGCLAAQCGEDLSMDDPAESTGTNPDVLASIGGRRWGLACKVLHGLNPEGFIQHIEKGIDQIGRSPADIGSVVFNLKNVLPHDRIWPIQDVIGSGDATIERAPVCWDDPRAPYAILMDELANLRNTLISYLPPDYLHTVFEGKKSIPGFLLWAHSVSSVTVNGKATAASVRIMNCANVADIAADLARALACLNWAAFAGSDRGPRPCP